MGGDVKIKQHKNLEPKIVVLQIVVIQIVFAIVIALILMYLSNLQTQKMNSKSYIIVSGTRIVFEQHRRISNEFIFCSDTEGSSEKIPENIIDFLGSTRMYPWSSRYAFFKARGCFRDVYFPDEDLYSNTSHGNQRPIRWYFVMDDNFPVSKIEVIEYSNPSTFTPNHKYHIFVVRNLYNPPVSSDFTESFTATSEGFFGAVNHVLHLADDYIDSHDKLHEIRRSFSIIQKNSHIWEITMEVTYYKLEEVKW